MALTYQSEYRIGRRTVTRTYGGARAFVAIGVDLVLGLILGVIGLAVGLVGWTLWLAWRIVVLVALGLLELVSALGRFVRDLIALPWRVARRQPAHTMLKPAMASFDEL